MKSYFNSFNIFFEVFFEHINTLKAESSIEMDAGYDPSNTDKVVESLAKTHFFLVRTGWYTASDIDYDAYKGLGRFAKECVYADNVTLLERVTMVEVEPCSPEELVDSIARKHLEKMLDHILSDAFKPEKYNEYIPWPPGS